ncbi:MAG: multiheme c-type cytochrome [Acidobacteriota bacterium]
MRAFIPFVILCLAAGFLAAAENPCVVCHEKEKVARAALRDWKTSKHAAQGIACDTCHLTGDQKAATSKCPTLGVSRSVSATACAACHEQQATQFANGKHALAWVAMNAMPTTGTQPVEIREGLKGCGGCHRIGLDGGKCDSCHTRHRFAAAEARRAEACRTCHMGFDHPQWEMYSTSKHGSIYELESSNTDWEKPLSTLYDGSTTPGPDHPRAPVCASCHMPEGDHGVVTAWGFLAVRLPEDDAEWMKDRATILQGLGVLDDKGNPTDRFNVVQAGKVARLTKEDFAAARNEMIAACTRCHTKSWAETEMAKGDKVVRDSDALMAAAVREVDELYKEGILKRPADVPFSVDLLRFYENRSPIEQKLWTMFLEHRMRAFQGAFHMNPDYQHWYGWAELKRDLYEIKDEAASMRRAHTIESVLETGGEEPKK